MILRKWIVVVVVSGVCGEAGDKCGPDTTGLYIIAHEATISSPLGRLHHACGLERCLCGCPARHQSVTLVIDLFWIHPEYMVIKVHLRNPSTRPSFSKPRRVENRLLCPNGLPLHSRRLHARCMHQIKT